MNFGGSERAIVPLDQVRKEFGWDTDPNFFLVQLLIRDHGLKLVAHGSQLEESIDCGGWVLGPGREHFFSFAGKGKWSKEFQYGALAQYGLFWREREESGNKEFLTIDEVMALSESGGEGVYYQETHIGITTDTGEVLSKWGGGSIGHVVQHSPHIVPYGYGELEYVRFSLMIEKSAGEDQEVLIMPRYLHEGFEGAENNLELILTDGKQQIGAIRGELKGKLGSDNSALVVSECVNMSQGEFPDLINKIIPHLEDQSPAIAGMIWLSPDHKTNEPLDADLIDTFLL